MLRIGVWGMLAAIAARGGDGVADRVAEGLQSARREAGVAGFERRADLDALARPRPAPECED